jgi:hypothetical protein
LTPSTECTEGVTTRTFPFDGDFEREPSRDMIVEEEMKYSRRGGGTRGVGGECWGCLWCVEE